MNPLFDALVKGAAAICDTPCASCKKQCWTKVNTFSCCDLRQCNDCARKTTALKKCVVCGAANPTPS